MKTPRSRRARQLHDAFRSLLLHRLRSLLSTLGIAIAVAAFVAMLAVGEGAKREILAQIRIFGPNTVLLRPASEKSGLSLGEMQALRRQLTSIERMGAMRDTGLTVTGVAADGSVPVYTQTGDFLAMRGVAAAEGRLLADLDALQRRRVALVGSAVSIRLGLEARPGRTLLVGGETYEIVGIMAPSQRASVSPALAIHRNLDDVVLIPVESRATDPRADDTLSVGEVWVEIPPAMGPIAGAESLRSAVQRLRPNAPQDGIQIVIPIEVLRRETAIRRVLNLVLAALGGISLLVGGIGVMNIMLANVVERRGEIGLRRAVGAGRAEIIGQFLVESTLLTVLGGGIGIVVGVLAAAILGVATGWSVAVTPGALLIALAAAALAGIGSGIYPARQAAGVPPAEALRG
ncbi:FtsX-like permease family protein [bacterium]|nr:FtsX-like permease family protein [bacterium]